MYFERYDLSISHFQPLFSQNDLLAFRVLSGVYRPEDPSTAILEGEQYIMGGATTLRGILDN
ncbi:MAG: hypothetical protein WC838_04675, partial [Candidatus Margulisiibacteriota bacterium]